MAYKIPTEERLSDAIFTVMYRNSQVRSQAELAKLVRKELSNGDEEYRVSEERVRLLAIKNKLVTISIEYNGKSSSLGLPETCPVCRSPMTSVMNRTLDGENKELKRKCSACPYTVSTRKNVPGRYIFTRPRK